jgi:hypothetical protein
MMRGTIGTLSGWLAALAVAWGLAPGLARAQFAAGQQGVPPGPAVGFYAPPTASYNGPPPVATFGPPPGAAQGCASCGAHVPTTFGNKCCEICCPHYHHCSEAPVHICFHHKCAKPVCNPCNVPHFGHWQKCWTPWPYGPDWGHCVAPPPAAQVVLNPAGHYIPGPVVTPAPQQRIGPGGEEEIPIPRVGSEGIRPGT